MPSTQLHHESSRFMASDVASAAATFTPHVSMMLLPAAMLLQVLQAGMASGATLWAVLLLLMAAIVLSSGLVKAQPPGSVDASAETYHFIAAADNAYQVSFLRSMQLHANGTCILAGYAYQGRTLGGTADI